MRFPGALFLFLPSLALAQQPALPGLNSQVTDPVVPPALLAAKARMADSLAVADRTVTSQWLTSLAELEKSRAVAGDYDGALRVRQRREQALLSAGTDDGRSPVVLTVGNNTRKGTGLLVADAATAEFRASGASIEWELTGDYRGWYEVLLTHAVMGNKDHSDEITPVVGNLPSSARKRTDSSSSSSSTPQAGGVAAFQSISGLGGSSLVLRREIVSTGGWNSYRTVSMGRIQFPSQTRLGKFRLSAEDVASPGLMHMRQLELVPVAEPAQAKEGENAELARVKEAFSREFRTRSSVSIAQYRRDLEAMEQRATRSKDIDLLARVQEELRLLTSAPEILAFSSNSEIASAPQNITLPVANSFGCQFRGETVIDSAKKFLTKLRPAGSASVTWRLPVFGVPSGVYQVSIDCRVPVSGGGTATLTPGGTGGALAGKALKVNIKPVATPARRAKKPTSSDEPLTADRRTEQPGEIVIGKNAETLTLTVDSVVHSDGWLMDLSSISLKRTGDVPDEKKDQ